MEAELRHWARAYSPIITWNGTIVDGHHRYEICKKYNLPFKVEEREFEDEIAVKRWMIKNQFSRRNLPIEERLRLAFEDTNLEELQAEAKERELAGKKIDPRAPVPTGQEKGRALDKVAEKESINDCQNFDSRTPKEAQKDWNESRVDAKLGKEARISREQVRKIKKLKEPGVCTDEEIKQLREGSVSINKKCTEKIRLERNSTLKATEFPKDKYRVIYADPPWEYSDKLIENYGGAEKRMKSGKSDPTQNFGQGSIETAQEKKKKT